MFDSTGKLTTQDRCGLVGALAHVDERVTNDERVDQLEALERVKAAVFAAQARLTAVFVEEEAQVASKWRDVARQAADDNDFAGWRLARDEARRHELVVEESSPRASASVAPRGRAARPWGRREDRVGVAAQVGLACRVSPSRAAGLVRRALTLVADLPGTLAAVESGELSEWRAEIVVRECEVLTPEHRRMVDAELTELMRRGELGRLGDRELRRRVSAVAYRVDAASVMERCRYAETQRRVTIRPAPDTMCFVTALLPVAQGVAVHAALVREAAAAKALGDERSRGQVMADVLVARATGVDVAQVGPVELQVVITDRALLSGAATPAHIPGYGTVPAEWVRDLVTPAVDESVEGAA